MFNNTLYCNVYHQPWTYISVIEILIVPIIRINIIIFFSFLLLLLTSTLIVRVTAPHNALANTTNPIILFFFRVGVQQKRSFGCTNFKGISLFGLQVGGLDRRALRQVDHTVRGGIIIFGEEEFASL